MTTGPGITLNQSGTIQTPIATGSFIPSELASLDPQFHHPPIFTPRSSAPPALPPSVSAPSSTATPRPRKVRRRNRLISACLECRHRKSGCDKQQPSCGNCIKNGSRCIYLAPAQDEASQHKLTELKEKVASLERILLERNAADAGMESKATLPEEEDEDDDERDLELTPLAVMDQAYGDEGEDDEVSDLGLAMGKMRISERIGGFFRPRASEEVSAFLFLERTLAVALSDGRRDSSSTVASQSPQAEQLPPIKQWLKPGPGYIAPGSNFPFSHGASEASLVGLVPSQATADRLIRQYFLAVHPIAKVVHRPTFERDYTMFYEDINLGFRPPGSVQAIVFSAMLSGIVSMDDGAVTREFGVVKSSFVENLRLGTENALGRANFLRTTKIQTLQAFVMYLIPLCRAEVSRAHSVLVGAAIRMAECMGLHRDGEAYGMNPLETHVRRLLWYQLCFLDIRTCEAQGPRPTIHRADFDTKLPFNVDDADLYPSAAPHIAADCWTDTTLSLVRFEVNEMMRSVWADQPRLDRKEISPTTILKRIVKFKDSMARYDKYFDLKIPIQRYAAILKTMLVSRLYMMVLHRYHSKEMPEKFLGVMVHTGLTVLETAISLERSPELRLWSWYTGAYQQYHIALLLCMELLYRPDREEADRIWACLDFVFGCDAKDPRDIKAIRIVAEVAQKTRVYQSMRGARAPPGMDKHLSSSASRSVEPPDTLLKNEHNDPIFVNEAQQLHKEIGPNVNTVGHQQDVKWSGPIIDNISSIQRSVQLDRPQFAGVSDGRSLCMLAPMAINFSFILKVLTFNNREYMISQANKVLIHTQGPI
ncbi:hypothetical protein B0O99DRAFT_519633 [Bisporella sp. PMI_857]|nr:hypothetical protein B0O99DRAFT_519633 [Bisporella sp. PMI_857]